MASSPTSSLGARTFARARIVVPLIVLVAMGVSGCGGQGAPERDGPAGDERAAPSEGAVAAPADGERAVPTDQDRASSPDTATADDPTAEPPLSLVREEDAAAAAGTARELDVAVARDFHPEVGALVFRLLGTPATAPGAPAMVTTIEVRDGDLPAVRQVLGPFEARAILDPYAGADDPYGGFFIEDLDFDGFPDLRLEVRPKEGADSESDEAITQDTDPGAAGAPGGPNEPNVPFLYWRYDSAAARFVRDEALEAIVSPVVDPVARQIRASWRDGPTDAGSDTWAWLDGTLTMVARERRFVREDGEAVIQFYQRDEASGRLALVEEIVAGEAPER